MTPAFVRQLKNILLLAVVLVSGTSFTSSADKIPVLNVAVASNFSLTANKLIEAFEVRADCKVNLITGSSGKLFAQISNGAPFDIFLSADSVKPAQLQRDGRVLDSRVFTYAIGQLVLLSAQPSAMPFELKVLNQVELRDLVIANPRLAPYGLAAKEYLQSQGLWPALENKLILAENIAQSFQYVSSKSVKYGFVAYSQVVSAGINPEKYRLIPRSLHQPIQQQGVALTNTRQPDLARAFVNYLNSTQVKTIIKADGYLLEENK